MFKVTFHNGFEPVSIAHDTAAGAREHARALVKWGGSTRIRIQRMTDLEVAIELEKRDEAEDWATSCAQMQRDEDAYYEARGFWDAREDEAREAAMGVIPFHVAMAEAYGEKEAV